jgi:hypothetical protein
MRFIRGFARFWYDFIIGDDWTIAAAVVVTLALTGLLARAEVAAWWVLPAGVIGFLGYSLRRAARGDR